jgi:hypothetical protein
MALTKYQYVDWQELKKVMMELPNGRKYVEWFKDTFTKDLTSNGSLVNFVLVECYDDCEGDEKAEEALNAFKKVFTESGFDEDECISVLYWW